MEWEFCLTVSVYDRDQWASGLVKDCRPKHERQFRAELPGDWTSADMCVAMRRTANQAQAFLARIKPDLVDQVVVSLYSLEAR